jgi:hypothetical protein
MTWTTSKKAYLSGIWAAVVIFLYLTLFTDDTAMKPPSSSMSLTSSSNSRRESPVDAVVYIAMKSAAKSTLVDYSVTSLRKVGGWKGKVFLLTDQPSCFDNLLATQSGVEVVQVPSVSSIMEIKSLKAKVFEHIPASIESVLYIDVDIVVAKSMESFFNELHVQIGSRKDIDMGAFLDAKGHFIGWCSGCEKWHTGVLLMFRQSGSKCLESWGSTILSSRFETDQESLDDAENTGACPKMLPFASSNLLFAKDYLAMAFTSGSTFWHVTAGARLEEQDAFYRKLVVPYLRSSLQDKIDSEVLNEQKTC